MNPFIVPFLHVHRGNHSQRVGNLGERSYYSKQQMWSPPNLQLLFPKKQSVLDPQIIGTETPSSVGLTRSPLAGPSSFLGLIYFFARLQTICLARQLKNWIWAKQFSVFHFSSSFTA